jgi:hypothetical protein
MDVELREWAFTIYEIQGIPRRQSWLTFNSIKNAGVKLEKQIFEVFNIYERRNLKLEALQFMEKWYYKWTRLCAQWLSDNKYKPQDEFKQVTTAEGRQIGFFTAYELGNEDLNNEINRRKIELENEEKKAKDKNLPKNNEVIEDGFRMGNAATGSGNENARMNLDIKNLIKVMEHDVEYHDAKDNIPRITSEQMNILKNKHKGDKEGSLENLNKLLKGLFDPNILNILRPD